MRLVGVHEVGQVLGELGHPVGTEGVAVRVAQAAEDQPGDLVGPVLELLAVVSRDAQHLGDHRGGQGVGIVGDQVDPALLSGRTRRSDHRVEELVGELDHPRADTVDGAGGEGTVDQPT